MPYFQDPVSEIIDLYATQSRRERIQRQAASVTPQQASTLSRYARYAQWQAPGVSTGLARAGIEPSDTRAAEIVNLSAALLGALPFAVSEDQAARGGGTVRAKQLVQPSRRRGPRGASYSAAVAPLRQQQSDAAREAGWRSLDEILAENPSLRQVVEDNSIVVKDGMLQRPRNTLTDEGKAFDAISGAFFEAGVQVPFVSSGEGWDDEEGRFGILTAGDNGSTNVRYLDEVLFPEEDSGGGGRFAGVTFNPTHMRTSRPNNPTDAIMVDNLRAAGIPIDPDNPFSFTAPIVRPGLMALDAPTQEVQGQFRNIVGAARGENVDWWETQSDLGVMLTENDLREDPGSAGMGFFVDPESQVAQERRERESKRGLIGGHNITIGRFLADTVTEPDTKPFLILSGVVDAGVQLADPSTIGLGKVGKIRAARAAFEAPDAIHDAAGLVAGIRRTIHGPTAAAWLDTNEGIRAVNALTKEQSPYRIWVAMNRRVDPEMAAMFAATRDTRDTRRVLEGVLGPYIRTTTEMKAATRNLRVDNNPFLSSLNNLNPRVSQSRLLRWMPGTQLDTQNPRAFATELERHMINAKVPVELQEEVFNEIASSTSRGGLMAAATKAMSHEKGVLVQYGLSQEKARMLTTLFRDSYESDVSAFIDEIGEDVPVWTKMMVDGEMVDVAGPHLVVEHLGRYIPLPDARQIRRLTSNPGLRFLTTTKGSQAFGQNRFPIALMDFLTQEMWKTTTLLGRFPAWITRVVGESQIRIAASGLDSVFRHPIDYFGVMAGRKITTDALGTSIDELEEFRNSLSQGHGGWLNRPGTVASSRPVAIKKGPEFESRYLDAWANELGELSYDPITNFLLNHSLAETERWLRVSDEGKKHLKFLQEAHPDNLKTSAQIQDYLHSLTRRVDIKTGGDTELVDALRSGQLRGERIFEGSQLNPKFRKILGDFEAAGPDVVKGYDVSYASKGNRFYDRYTAAVDRMFSMTMGFADNLWDRAPVFKQYLWQHTAELLPYADDTTKALIVARAEKANLPDRMMNGIYRAAKRGSKVDPADALGMEELNTLAKGYAADSAKKLLYDLNQKGQLADAMRIIAPFGNAYQEIFSSWGKILNEIGGPGTTGKIIGMTKLLRRGQQLVEGARGQDFGQLMGAPVAPDGTQMGFFMKDERGEEVFVIPGSQWLTNAVAGVPVPLTGSVKGLNMIGNMVPGLGPVAAIPVAKMIQNKPQFQDLNDLLLPYGAPGDRNEADVFNWMTYAPPWFRTAFNAASDGGYDQRTWANAQKDVMAYLYSTGEYDTTTRSGMNKLLDDAQRKARDLYFIKSFAQVGAPTSPSFRFLVQDKSGALLSLTTLVDEYQQLKEVDYENADQLFLEQYGSNAILATIPKSGSSTYGIPRTKEQHQFLLENPGLNRDFPSTYGLFLPQDGEFDYDVYLGAFDTGDREDLSPEQWLNLTNSVRGDYLYNTYKEQAGTRTDPAAREWLRGIRQQIVDMYPSGPTGLPEKPDTEELINELYVAVQDDRLADTDAGQGLALYLTYRDQALAAAQSIPGRTGFNRSRDTRHIRAWLNQVAEAVIERHPEFQFMWDIVLSRETTVAADELDELEGV